MFLFNKRQVEYCSSYKYLGVTLNEFLDYNLTANIQAESAGRALGAIIAKSIKAGGLPFKVFTMLYDSCCATVAEYGSEIWGYKDREDLLKVHMRAARVFLGVPKHTAKPGILAEINWLQPAYRTRIRMVRQYFRVEGMDSSRLTKRILSWDKDVAENANFKTWYSEVTDILNNHNVTNFGELGIEELKRSMWKQQKTELYENCQDKPKLKLYCRIMDIGCTPAYLQMPLTHVQKMFLAKLRLSALPLRIETGRYERPHLPTNDRICLNCSEGVEDEEHLLFSCKKYDTLRKNWVMLLQKPENYDTLSITDKLRVVLDSTNAKATGQFLIDCFNVRYG